MPLKRDRMHPVKLLGGSLLNPPKCYAFPRPLIWFSCFHETHSNDQGVWWGPCSDTWQQAPGFALLSAFLDLCACLNLWTSLSSSLCMIPPVWDRGASEGSLELGSGRLFRGGGERRWWRCSVGVSFMGKVTGWLAQGGGQIWVRILGLTM